VKWRPVLSRKSLSNVSALRLHNSSGGERMTLLDFFVRMPGKCELAVASEGILSEKSWRSNNVELWLQHGAYEWTEV
jgi:hypothetical protein